VLPEAHKMVGRSARNALPGALLLVGIIAMYHWVVAPHVAYLRAVERLAPAVERMAVENDRLRRTLGPSLRHLQRVRQEQADIQAGLFTGGGCTAFIRALPSRVEQSGCLVVVADFTGGSEPRRIRAAGPEAAFSTRHVGMTVRGTMDQIAAVLDWLQENRPRVWVDAFRMERVAAGPGPMGNGRARPAPAPEAEQFSASGADLFQCQMVLTLYTRPDPAPAGAPESGNPVP
jgi:hypothetical protein